MDIVGLIALVICSASIFSKMFFSFRIRSLERVRTLENEAFQSAKNDLHTAEQANKRHEAEIKQQEARRKTTQRNIKNIEKTLQEYETRKRTEDEVRAQQAEMLRGGKSQ
ncbi:MAG: hypothetical protein QGG64_17305 [Candidatus Latescibacteria bacterium]|jgi:septal ring factor EnvC (AmiA/AmiB activator)|nr:hypothetical protein [Candidatus Latescibacterota bacterium]